MGQNRGYTEDTPTPQNGSSSVTIILIASWSSISLCLTLFTVDLILCPDNAAVLIVEKPRKSWASLFQLMIEFWTFPGWRLFHFMFYCLLSDSQWCSHVSSGKVSLCIASKFHLNMSTRFRLCSSMIFFFRTHLAHNLKAICHLTILLSSRTR